jgi:hypothetical protein
MRQQQPNRLQPGHRSEHLVEVDALALDVAFGNQPGFVLEDVSSGIALDLKNPFQANGALTACRRIHQDPGPIGFYGVHLHLHHLVPAALLLGLGKQGRFISGSEQK